MDDQKVIRTALASFGLSGRIFHAPFLAADTGFSLAAVLERTKNLSREIYPDARIVRSFDELLQSDDIDLIVVNTPDATHYPYAKRALESGKHVVVEKPFVLDVAQGEELIAIAAERGLALAVYQNRRWDADFLTARKIIGEGILGRLVEYEAVYSRFRNHIRPGTWKETGEAGGGLVFNLGSHMIDQAVELFGMPEGVYAEIDTLREGGMVDDYFLLRLKYPEVKVSLKASYLIKIPAPTIALHGTRGSFVKYSKDIQEAALHAGQTPGQPWWGEENENDWGIISVVDGEDNETQRKYRSVPGDYGAFYRNLHEHLTLGEELLTDARKSLDVIKIIHAAIRSNSEGAVVGL